MKTSGPESSQEGLATAQHRRKWSGISSEELPSARQQRNFTSQTHYKIKLIFLQLGKMWYFARKKKKAVFFHRSCGNKTKTFQNSLHVVCPVLECALVGPIADGVCLKMEAVGTHARKTAVTRRLWLHCTGSPFRSLATLSQGLLSPFKHPMPLIPEHLPHLDIWAAAAGGWRGAFQRRETKELMLAKRNEGQKGLEAMEGDEARGVQVSS